MSLPLIYVYVREVYVILDNFHLETIRKSLMEETQVDQGVGVGSVMF